MVNTNGNIFFKFLIDVECDRDFTILFEIFLKSFQVIEGSANDDFCTYYFEGLTLERSTFDLLLAIDFR